MHGQTSGSSRHPSPAARVALRKPKVLRRTSVEYDSQSSARDDVRVFVPERAAPIKFASLACRGRILCNHKTKTDAERAESGNAKRAHGEVFVVVEDLDDDRTAGRETIFRSQLCGSFFEKIRRVGRQHVALLRRSLNDERAAPGLFEIAH